MSAQSDLIGIGPFSKKIAPNLDYPISCYKDCQEGQSVVSTVIVCETTSSSTGLADVLGFNLRDFNKHIISSEEIIAKKKELMDWADEYSKEEQIFDLLDLAQHNWKFLFIPNC